MCPCGVFCMIPFFAPVLLSRYRSLGPATKTFTLLAVPLFILAAASRLYPEYIYATPVTAIYVGCALFFWFVRALPIPAKVEKDPVTGKPCTRANTSTDHTKPAAAPAARAA